MMQSDHDEFAVWARRIFGVVLALIVLLVVVKVVGFVRGSLNQVGGIYREAEEWGP